jgi:hypothetical protein
MSANTWGHTLQKLSEEQRAKLDRWDSACRAPGQRGSRGDGPTTHLATYQYVTGRAGRVSFRRIYMCDVHAEKFRAKHNLPAPEVASTPKHALERILEGGAS